MSADEQRYDDYDGEPADWCQFCHEPGAGSPCAQCAANGLRAPTYKPGDPDPWEMYA